MREALLEHLRCPACRAERSFTLAVGARDAQEVRDGTLTCAGCGRAFGVEEGIANLLHAPPGVVTREAAGLERFADRMRADGWDRERIRSLPDVHDAYWHGQRVSFDQLIERVDFRPGQTLLDVGANTCWASNLLAGRGLEVIALDITVTELQGLRTAEYFIDAGEVYFERVLSNMADPAIASSSLDYVLCCEVLHHNDADALRRTFRELHRVLKLLVINEPMRFPLHLKRDHATEVAEFEGHEHTYFFHQYWLGTRRAGFAVDVLAPPYLPFLFGPLDPVSVERGPVHFTKTWVHHQARRVRPLRAACLAWLTLVKGDFSLNMIATKRQSR